MVVQRKTNVEPKVVTAKVGGGLSASTEAKQTKVDKAEQEAKAQTAKALAAANADLIVKPVDAKRTSETAKIIGTVGVGAGLKDPPMPSLPTGLNPLSQPLMADPKTVDGTIEKVKDLATATWDAARRKVERAVDAVDQLSRGFPDADELKTLNDGDKITVGADEKGKVRVYRAVDGEVEVGKKTTVERTKEPPGYKVQVEGNGNLGAGISSDALEAEARGGGKITTEYVIKDDPSDPEKSSRDAQRVVELANKWNPSNPTPGWAEKELAQQAEEMEFLNKRRSSIEVQNEVVFELSGTGAPDVGLGFEANAKLKPSDGAKIEFDENGKAKSVTFKSQTETEVEVMQKLYAGNKKGGISVSPEMGVKSKVTITRETTVNLPESFDVSRLSTDPKGVYEELKKNTTTKPTEVTIETTVGDSETKMKLVPQDGKNVDVAKLVADSKQDPMNGPVKSRDEILRDANVKQIEVETFERSGFDMKGGVDVEKTAELEVHVERTTRRRTSQETIVIPS